VRARWLVVGAVIAAVVAAIVWWRTGGDLPARPIARAFDAAGPASATPQPATETASPQPSPAVVARAHPPAAPMPRAEPGPHHAADPCNAATEPVVPTGFDTLTASGVTIAWSPDPPNPGPLDMPFRPLVLAHVVAGILDEAATFTATPRRPQLTVIVYPTRDELIARTQIPAWADGVYDGAAVSVPVSPRGELGVSIATLRHEVMHAQLHVGAGCMPSWFNEGVAMYFAGPPPLREWLAMLRTPEAFDLQTLRRPAIDDAASERANRLYAQSLAMVVFVAEHSPATGVRDAVQMLHSARTDLWEQLCPRATDRTVLDALAQKLFGLPLGGELDAVLKGSICCYGLRSTSDVGCRPAGDKTATPRALCAIKW